MKIDLLQLPVWYPISNRSSLCSTMNIDFLHCRWGSRSLRICCWCSSGLSTPLLQWFADFTFANLHLGRFLTGLSTPLPQWFADFYFCKFASFKISDWFVYSASAVICWLLLLQICILEDFWLIQQWLADFTLAQFCASWKICWLHSRVILCLLENF